MKRILSTLLTLIMVLFLLPPCMLTARAEGEGYVDVFYLKPPQFVNEMKNMDSASYLEVTYYTISGAMQSSRMVNVGNEIYGAAVRQTVTMLECRLKATDGSELWMNAVAPSSDAGYNMACYSEGQEGAVWDVFGTQIGSSTVPGVLYFTPSETWASQGNRFAVCFISADNSRIYEELVPMGDGSFAISDMECVKYQFVILRENATAPDQFSYASAQLTKHGEENNHCLLIENESLAGATGQWKKREQIENPDNIVNIYFDSNGGTGIMFKRTCPLNSIYVLPYCTYTPPLGMAFKAWNVNGAEHQAGDGVLLNLHEVVITAIWKDAISVTYTANGGGGDDIIVYLPDARTITLPENTFIAPAEKSFKTWNVNGTEYPPGKQISISENTVIEAVWRDGYTITYDPNGGNGGKNVATFEPHAEITLAQNKFSHPEKYEFLGWEINGVLYSPGESYVITSNVVAYARWNKTVTVEYIFISPASNQYTFTETVTEGGKYVIKSPYVLEGITFNERYEISGWRNGGVLYEEGQEIELADSISLTLDYKYKLYRTFYYDNNYVEEIQYTVYKDEEFIIPECTFTPPEGYMLEYWQESTDTNKKYYPGDKYVPDTSYSDGTFYAVWVEATELHLLDQKIKDGILAGMEYTLPRKTKKLSDGSFTAVIWGIKEQGTTGASLSDGNILTVQKAGNFVISARVPGGMEDGLEFYEEYEISVSADYQIRTADDLFDFAERVNNGYLYINAILMNDIDLEKRPWTPIGKTGGVNSHHYRGTFDGNHKKITGLYVEGTDSGVGFFGEIRNGVVKDFEIHGDVVVSGAVAYVGGAIGSVCGTDNENGAHISGVTSYVNLKLEHHGVGRVGGFIGYANHKTTIENCAWYGTFDLGVYRAEAGVAGFLGRVQENSDVTIRNCAAYGTVKTNYEKGTYNSLEDIYVCGFLGWSVNGNNTSTVLENCLFAGSVELGENCTDKIDYSAFGCLAQIERIANCYYLGENNLPGVNKNTTYKPSATELVSVTKEQLASGEVAYKLGTAFGQKIKTDPKPVLGGAEVYKYADGYSNELKFGFADYTAEGASVNIPTAGTYSLVFADYEGKGLQDIDVVTFTVTADKVGKITKTSEKGITMGTGDKIMLRQGTASLVPMCKALIIE